MSGAFARKIAGADPKRRVRSLVFVLGDQLDTRLPALSALDRNLDAVFMAEVAEEATHVPSHRQRTVLFLAAMRHFAGDLVEKGLRVRYVPLDGRGNTGSLGAELERAVKSLRPERIVVTRPGDHRVEGMIERSCERAGARLETSPDDSFTCTIEEFDRWAEGRKELVMEHFYRTRRRQLGLLVNDRGEPEGGAWNFDKENRESFSDPPDPPRPYRPRPDAVTREVMRLVEETWPDAYGKMEHFRWPVTPAEARRALEDFIENRLADFGPYEDAMWAGEPVLFHSRLAAALNLKLIRPIECVEAAVRAYEKGRAPLNSVEGFVRQIIGWREFIRGVYYREGPDYISRNGLGQDGRLPEFYWTGDTDMDCMKHCLGEVVENAWGHHIPRLMVIGNFALISGVRPDLVNDWFLAMYVDAVDWVTAPNVVGMSQHADGGVVGTKPYAGSGRYIDRMSNYCGSCRYDVKERSGDGACPFNTFYWDFLIRHRKRFRKNRRMAMAVRNLDRLDDGEKQRIRSRARSLRRRFGIDR